MDKEGSRDVIGHGAQLRFQLVVHDEDGEVRSLRLAFSLQSTLFVSRRLVCDDRTGGRPCAVELLEVDGVDIAMAQSGRCSDWFRGESA